MMSSAGRPLSAVGPIAQLTEGQRVKLTGVIVEHPRFGRQIEVEFAEAVVPSSVEGIEAYLSSRLIKGIGPAIAARITETFGNEALRIIEEEPHRLKEIKGLGAKRVEDEAETVDRILELRASGLSVRAIAIALQQEGRRIIGFGIHAGHVRQSRE